MSALRAQLSVPKSVAGCHTAKMGAYVIEGHVPADQVKHLLREKPDVVGISVPGMPVGSPGMEGPGGHEYDVMVWRKDGSTSVFAREKPLAR
ncbi:MAG TPA: DUF411 domain-containing protein [Burkholderiales bacterium]|nr:DUF411 domain-containing protein [Burkholderiales bacterium]